MKNIFKVLKLRAYKEDSLFNNLKSTLREDFSLSLELNDFKALVKDKRIRIRGREISEPQIILQENESFSVSLTKSQFKQWSLPIKESIKISPEMIIHEEPIFLIGNKPANLSSNATIQSSQDNFLCAMKRYISGPHKEKYLALHHRIDYETSGLLLFCKKKSQNKFFTELFENRIIKKTYLAVVIDQENNFSDTKVSNLLERDPSNKMKVRSVKTNGKSALTSFKKISHAEGFSLIEATPETGRLHQIRVHLSELGFPIAGDSIYGNESNGRTLLHAYKLKFPHPISHEVIEFCAPIPSDFPKELFI